MAYSEESSGGGYAVRGSSWSSSTFERPLVSGSVFGPTSPHLQARLLFGLEHAPEEQVQALSFVGTRGQDRVVVRDLRVAAQKPLPDQGCVPTPVVVHEMFENGIAPSFV